MTSKRFCSYSKGVERCNFVGNLASDPLSSVAMTGCLGTEDVEFTIFSKNIGSMYRWTKEGEVEEIENPLKVGGSNKLFKLDLMD